MVGLADIPCVGKFVERISEYTVDAVFRGLHYMFCYKALVNDLNSEFGKLNIEKDKMSRKAKEEKDNGKIIQDYVLKWQNDVEEIQKSAKEVSPSCSCIQRLPIPNPVSRFRIGRNAAKKAKTVAELAGTGKDYLGREIAHLPPVQNMPKPDTAFEEFQSRKDVYNKLKDALVNEDSPLIHGIHGMAGVGKTRMMEKIWEDVMKKMIFKEVVRVDVGSENLKEVDLQDKIADRLNCKLESQDMGRRASQLENSLKSRGKILLILDDVWRDIHLNKVIGTSLGDGSSFKGSKILLTSRERGVCLNNKCEHLVELETLSPDEALYLFKNAVGPDTINSLQDESLVRNVCDKCGRLPLIIHAVGKALKGKRHNSWKDAHNQLKEGKFEKIAGVDRQVYTGIKLSIDYLQNDDAKSCLFLCSMFPEDANINMKMLIQLATGSRLIPDGESRVLAMVDYLKTSSLLLDSEIDNETKVHDIIRDVARSIASTDSKYAFLQVTCSSQYLPYNADYSTRRFLCIDVETDDFHFNEHLVCPDLHTLWLQSKKKHPQQFSGGFYSMFVNLSCLMLQKVNISLEQFSLQPMGNLGTLSLLRCDMRKTDGSLFPNNLKTLCIDKCDLPKPLDVANLKCLQKLEIHDKRPVLVMVNVISSLSSLEELHISSGFINEPDHKNYHLEPIVMDISKLTRLKSLAFEFWEDNTFQGTDILFSNIDRYHLFLGTSEPYERQLYWEVTRSINLKGNHSKSWEGLMARAEVVRLRDSDVEVSSICNGHRGAFQDLKTLYIDNCPNMGHLASISQNEIQVSLQSPACFSKLTSLKISHCSKLKYLFCNNIAKSLVQLQELSVSWCDSMEAIIMNEGTSDGEIDFSKLTKLGIWGCYEMKYLFCNNIAKSLVQLQELTVKHCKSMEAIIMNEGTSDGEIINFSKLKSLTISDTPRLTSFYAEISVHPYAQYQPLFDVTVAFPSLEYIQVDGCHSLRSMFPSSVARHLTHLKEMEVEKCNEMREIIEAGEQEIADNGILFPQLTNIYLHELQSLMSFWCDQGGKASACKVPLRLPQLSSIVLEKLPRLKSLFHGAYFEFHMPALKKVEVVRCGLSILFTCSVFLEIRQLEELDVSFCKSLERIVEEVGGDETSEINGKSFTAPQLSSIVLEKLPRLKSLFHGAYFEFHMPALKNVKIVGCGLSILFTCSVFRKMQQLEELHVSDCDSLEHIVEEVGGEETSEINGKSITLTQLTKVVEDLTCDKIITLTQLTKVVLIELPNLKRFFHNANYEFHMPALKEVYVESCGLSSLFALSVFRNSQLEKLQVRNCELLENIVEDLRGDETCDKIITFSQLTIVLLVTLPNLKSSFHNANYEFHMPALKEVTVGDSGLSNTLFTRYVFKNLKQLEKLSVCDCELLEGIFEDAREDETLDTSDKIITLNRVSEVCLKGLPKFKSIFYGATYECHMPSLRYLDVYGCGLSILFTCSVFREVQQLENLYVDNCESLERIVEEVGGEETSGINGKSITLSQLSTISLKSLPNLKSFSSTASYVFNMPKLSSFWLIQCPQVEYFSSSKTNKSKVFVTSDWTAPFGILVEDLNDFIRQNHKSESERMKKEPVETESESEWETDSSH